VAAVAAWVGPTVWALAPSDTDGHGTVFCATCGCTAAKGAKGETKAAEAPKASCDKAVAAGKKACCPSGKTATAAKGTCPVSGKTGTCPVSGKALAAKGKCGATCSKPCCEGPAGKLSADAFALELKDQEGKNHTLASDAKYTVLVWYNWDCPFVKRHLKAATLNRLVDKYEDKKVAFVAINSTKFHDVKRNHKEHKAHELDYPVLDDHKGALGRLAGAKTTPHVVITDQKGRVFYNGAIDNDPRGKKSGQEYKNYADEALTALLAGEKVSVPKTKPYGCSVKYAPAPKKAVARAH
jgi:peroxiredoxin